VDFVELEAFVTLARELHFARAAEALNASASTLSRIVGRLEEEAGARLFERDTRRVALTPAGATFLSFAEDALRRRDQLRQSLDSLDGRLRGTLRVYASVTACYTILPPLVAALGKDHPELRLSVETGDPSHPREMSGHMVEQGIPGARSGPAANGEDARVQPLE